MSSPTATLADLERALRQQQQALAAGDPAAVSSLTPELDRIAGAMAHLAGTLPELGPEDRERLRRAAELVALNRQLLERALGRTSFLLGLLAGGGRGRHLVDRRV